MSKKVLIFILLSLLCVNAFGASVGDESALPGDGATIAFVGTVQKVAPDPVEGAWVVLHVIDHSVMVWYRAPIVRKDDEVLIFAIYLGTIVYPLAGEIPAYVGWYYRVVEADGESD